jgi:hypothetical protein
VRTENKFDTRRTTMEIVGESILKQETIISSSESLNDLELELNKHLMSGYEIQGGISFDGEKYLVILLKKEKSKPTYITNPM